MVQTNGGTKHILKCPPPPLISLSVAPSLSLCSFFSLSILSFISLSLSVCVRVCICFARTFKNKDIERGNNLEKRNNAKEESEGHEEDKEVKNENADERYNVCIRDLGKINLI